MRILLLSQWYFPETVSGKINTLGNEFIKLGNEVTCFTGFPNYPKGVLYEGYKIKPWQKEVIDGVEVIRFPIYPYHGNNKLKRIFNYFSLAFSTLFIGIFFARKFDVIFLYDSLLAMGLPALFFSKLFKKPLIFEIQDMYPETLSATGMVSSQRVLNLTDKYSRYVCKKADVITVISQGFKNNLIKKGISKNKIHVIPNWADEKYFYPATPDAKLIDELGLKDKFNIIFAGNIGQAQELGNVIKAAEELKQINAINFVFIGDGNDLERIKKLAAEQKLTNIKFISRKPVEEISKYLALADVLLIHLKKDPVFEITIPSKTIAYLAVGKPILCVASGDAANVINNANAGMVCKPGEPAKLANAVINMYDMPKEKLTDFGKNGRTYYETHFRKQVIMMQYQNILSDLVNKAVTDSH